MHPDATVNNSVAPVSTRARSIRTGAPAYHTPRPFTAESGFGSMILLEFSAVMFGLALIENIYSLRLLWPVLTGRETVRERCGFFSFTAGAVVCSCLIALPERFLCMMSDPRLFGPCGTEVLWHVFCWGEMFAPPVRTSEHQLAAAVSDGSGAWTECCSGSFHS